MKAPPKEGHAIITRDGAICFATAWSAKHTRKEFCKWLGGDWAKQKKFGFRCIKVNITPK